jgi:hypothetical protein
MMICKQTMQICMTPNMCMPFGGCNQPEARYQSGWQCPVCKKVSAPWAPSCQNTACGIDLTAPACAGAKP